MNRAAAVILVLALGSGCGVSTVKIEGHSMEPALADGERAWVTKSVDRVDRGDIVALRWPKDESRSFVQRVVGLPGDAILSADGQISINDKALDEPYVLAANRSKDSWGPIRIPDGQYFVMGDNRRNSSDSRAWGLVRRELVWGRVMGR